MRALAQAAIQKGRIVPYVIAWFLGVPFSILLVIFLLRGCE